VSATLGRTRINDIQIAALGSGLASGFAPFVLGRLSDVTNLRTNNCVIDRWIKSDKDASALLSSLHQYPHR
jgi:hypothetical protein